MHNIKDHWSLSRGMKNLLLFCVALMNVFILLGQEIDNHKEFGVMGGVATYTGDLNTGLNANFKGPAVNLFYRNNYPNNIVVLRINLLAANISGNEESLDLPLPDQTKRDLDATLTELSAVIEYNFFDFRSLKPGNDFPVCPYLFGGLGIGTVWQGEAPAFLSLPFGAGVKLKVGDRLNMGFEFGARKTFTDNLDGVDNDVDLNSSSGQDWYYFTGVSISYTKYFQKCPRNSPKIFR
jgi:hypothetical protein